MQKKRNIKRILYWVVIALLIGVILYCGGRIAYKVITDAHQKALMDELLSTMPSSTRPPIPTGVTDPTVSTESTDNTEPTQEDTIPTRPVYPESEILFEYRALYQINNDMVGFIEIPGTRIRYPVVQTPTNPNYYLRRNFYKEYSDAGSIYVREACNVNTPSNNVTMYGHRMNNGTMFADLHKYKSKSFWEENRYIYFDTLTEYHTYEIFAVFQVEANRATGFNYHLFDDTNDAAEFGQYVNTCKLLSYYETDIKPVYGDKLITLSTCDRSIEDGRLVVVAKRVL